MTSDITSGTDLIGKVFTQQSLFGSGLGYLITLGVVGVSTIAISPRKLSNMKTLAFPLAVGLKLIGLQIPLVLLAILGILFVIDTLSLSTLGSIVEAVTTRSLEAVQYGSRNERFNRKKSKAESKEAMRLFNKGMSPESIRMKLDTERIRDLEKRAKLEERTRKILMPVGEKITVDGKKIDKDLSYLLRKQNSENRLNTNFNQQNKQKGYNIAKEMAEKSINNARNIRNQELNKKAYNENKWRNNIRAVVRRSSEKASQGLNTLSYAKLKLVKEKDWGIGKAKRKKRTGFNLKEDGY